MIDPSIPHREILWNVSSIGNVIVMYSLFALSAIIGGAGVFRRVESWSSGKPSPENQGQLINRFLSLFKWGLFQHGVNRDRSALVFHSLIYLGFLVLLFTTTMVLIDHDFGIPIYRGDFYLAITILSDVFGFGLLIGLVLATHRRYIKTAKRIHNRSADSLMLTILAVLVVQGFLLEGLRIHATNDQWAIYSPVGNLVSKLFWGFSLKATTVLHFAIWWFHSITVFAGFAILPYTKFFHIISSSANLFFKSRSRPKGQLESIGDLEKMMESGEEFSLGLGSIKDYSWKHLLDLDACTSCGRCQEVCPAYLSGKPLSPKWMILDTRNHMLSLHADRKLSESLLPSPLPQIDSFLTKNLLLSGSGIEKNGDGYKAHGTWRAENKLVQDSALTLGRSSEDRISSEVMGSDVFWSCTTCMACVEACPVGIQHVDHIVGNRRNMVLMQGEIPHEAQGTLRSLESRTNPYGDPNDRVKWADGLPIKIVSTGDEVDYLYWVGCVSAFDQRKQKIAKSLVTLMNKAGLNFGILGNAEGCTGDPARRLGEENLFQSMAKSNIEILKSIKFKTLVANCPHCFNTIKNEYPEFGNLGENRKPEIIHHSVLLRRLLKDDKLKLKDSSQEFTFHDPCYLGRYNDEYEAPREALTKIKGLKIKEMDKSREKGLCCGAGGGHFWMDLKIGERVNSIRVNQAAETGVNKIATACPFCMQMMEDGVKLTNREDSMEVRDIAEVLAEQVI